ncbi:hypothetical protein ACGF1Z_19555 [Streptomyces sp. NPDC048018]|uniref:hypothetical protein n=1 Tax=Streptomyces sp. NPDC048018 TaxID=3365499 RepID=UPI00372104C8
MNPESYTALYGPGHPQPVSRRGQTGAAVLAGVVWAVVSVLLGGQATMVLVAVFVGAAAGEPVGGLLLGSTLIGTVALGAPVALTFLPPARRLSVPARFLLAGGVALPIALGIVAWVATRGR